MQGPPWRWGWRRARRGRGRPPKPRRLWKGYAPLAFIPVEPSQLGPEPPVVIGVDELEALRLVYLEGLSQQEAAELMGVSRGTLWRLLDSGRRKLVEALVEAKPILVSLGETGE